MNDRTKTPPIHDPELDRRVKDAGASKTVYALVTPETEAAKNFILGNAVAGPDAARRRHLEQFRDAWTGKQYASHEVFIERWCVGGTGRHDRCGRFSLALPDRRRQRSAVSCDRSLRQRRAG